MTGAQRSHLKAARMAVALILANACDREEAQRHGSPAEAAGLRAANIEPNGGIVPGDIIIAVDSKAVESVARLVARLDEKKPGDAVKLTLLRDGKHTEVRSTLKATGS